MSLHLPRNWFLSVFTLASLIALSFLFYSFYQARQAIPCRGHTVRPDIRINEGGASCFAIDSLWFRLKHGEVSAIEDALWLGGTDPKFLLSLHNQNSLSFLWKPQLPVGKAHSAMAQNEVIVFHLDCLLGLRRTPAAAVYPIDLDDFQRSLLERTRNILDERRAEWSDWESKGTVHGAAQVMWPGAHHVNAFGELTLRVLKKWCKYLGLPNGFYVYLLGGNSASIRELSSRDMLDYITGNWDRKHNQFFIHNSRRWNTELIYLDHNHLKRTSQVPFDLNHCKFWREDVDNLENLVNLGIRDLLERSLNTYEPDFHMFRDQSKPLDYLQSRSVQFLAHVNDCVAQYGSTYVFED